MKTILITSQKGGSGKTMLAAHLSVEAERKGDPAWLIDTDRQATLTRWHERRQRDTPRLGEIRFEKLGMGLDRLRESGAAYCFIDTSPTISNQTSSLLRFADLVLIPVRPSPCDLWAVIADGIPGQECRQAVSLHRHPRQAASAHHRASDRSVIGAWPGGPNFHLRSRSLCRGHDRRKHGAGAHAEGNCRAGDRGSLGGSENMLY